MNRIITDSCCDLTPDMKEEFGIVSVPMTMNIGNEEFLDDEQLDIKNFMVAMGNNTGKANSSAPPPSLFHKAIEATKNAFVITLSSRLSGSFGNAVSGNQLAIEDGEGAECVLDTKTASAGETLVAIKLHELISIGMAKERIIETIQQFINETKTYFVLENYTNLIKNGRIGKVTASFVQMLNIKLILGDDGNGEITLYEKCRGTKRMIQRMLSLIETSGRRSNNENIVISHCDNPGLAEQFQTLIREKFNFKHIYVVPTGGISSLYADQKGIILAF